MQISDEFRVNWEHAHLSLKVTVGNLFHAISTTLTFTIDLKITENIISDKLTNIL